MSKLDSKVWRGLMILKCTVDKFGGFLLGRCYIDNLLVIKESSCRHLAPADDEFAGQSTRSAVMSLRSSPTDVLRPDISINSVRWAVPRPVLWDLPVLFTTFRNLEVLQRIGHS
jgi:hypothetical protein